MEKALKDAVKEIESKFSAEYSEFRGESSLLVTSDQIIAVAQTLKEKHNFEISKLFLMVQFQILFLRTGPCELHPPSTYRRCRFAEGGFKFCWYHHSSRSLHPSQPPLSFRHRVLPLRKVFLTKI